ncbi:hypothetical protein [Pseudomonas sp. MPB03]|uniref:hypothetical protein n=1 Tax=Pseudomonas sp. MPB03 TaxID=3388489 RepID=UPI00398488A8
MPNHIAKNTLKPKFPWTLVKAVNSLLFLSGVVCISVGSYHLVQNSIATAGTGLGAGLVLLFAATIERFESLKGMSMEVTTRKLDAKILEADNAVRELKELAEIFGYNMSLTAAKIGRPNAHFTFIEGLDLTNKIRENLTHLKCDRNSISHALYPWVRTTMFDLGKHLLQPINDEIHKRLHHIITDINNTPQPVDKANEKYNELYKTMRILADYCQPGLQTHLLDISQIKGEASKYILLTPILSEDEKKRFHDEFISWNEEIDYFLSNSEIRTPDRWSLLFEQQSKRETNPPS